MTDAWNQKTQRTVGDLRSALAGLPDHVPVLATWEGIYRLFASEGVRDTEYGPALVFDVEYHWPDPI